MARKQILTLSQRLASFHLLESGERIDVHNWLVNLTVFLHFWAHQFQARAEVELLLKVLENLIVPFFWSQTVPHPTIPVEIIFQTAKLTWIFPSFHACTKFCPSRADCRSCLLKISPQSSANHPRYFRLLQPLLITSSSGQDLPISWLTWSRTPLLKTVRF